MNSFLLEGWLAAYRPAVIESLHWITAMLAGSHSEEVHSTVKHLLLPLNDIMQDLKFYLSRSLFDFFFFFSHPLQSPESQMTAVKPIPKSIIQYSAWCQDTSSYRVKIRSSDFVLMQRCQDSTGYKDIQAFLQYALCRVKVRRPNRLWLTEVQPPFFPLKALVVQPGGRGHCYK